MKSFIAVSFLIMGLGNTYVFSQDNRSPLEKYSKTCGQNNLNCSQSYVKEAYFSPTRRLGKDCEQRSGTWCYEHLTPKNKNRYDELNGELTATLTKRENCPKTYPYCSQISFYSSVKPKDGCKKVLPKFIWHVISVPRPPNFLLDGYMLRTEEAVKNKIIKSDDRNLLLKSKAVTTRFGEIPVYLDGIETELNNVVDLWAKLVGNDAFKTFMAEARDNSSVKYDHTFYIMELPQDISKIGRDGWRHVSDRTAAQEGKAYGFILDPTGKCIASDTLHLRRQ